MKSCFSLAASKSCKVHLFGSRYQELSLDLAKVLLGKTLHKGWAEPLLVYVGFSLHWVLLLQSVGSGAHGFSCYGTWTQQLQLADSRAWAQ